MKSLISKNKFPLGFIVLMLAMSLFYGYLKIFHFSPRSTHQWRQADSASLALNYYEDGLNFFKPRMHYAMGGEGYVTGAGEAPIFYYAVALLYSIFGPNEGLFRILSLLTFLLGLFLISKILVRESGDWFSPIALSGIIMGSPVIAFYSFNFTPNIPAQGLAMVGIWFFYLFYKTQKLRHFHWSMFFYTLAGLIKISSLMSYGIILGLYALDIVGIFKWLQKERIFKKAYRFLPGFLAVIAAIFAWKLWADQYNEVHNTSYFLSKIRPYWSIDQGAQDYVMHRIKTIWFPSYYSKYTFWTLVTIGSLILVTPRRHKPILYTSFLALICGCTAFFFLWFRQFEGHDYYVIEMVLLPIIVLSMLILALSKHLPSLLGHWIFRVLLIVAVAYNTYYSKTQIDFRYNPESVFMSYFNPDLFKRTELHAFLRSKGIERTDKVVVSPDTSPNNTLYHYDLRGWTELYVGTSLYGDKVKANAKAGAKYLLIHDKKYLEKPELKEVLKYPLGNFNNSIFVFDLRPFKGE